MKCHWKKVYEKPLDDLKKHKSSTLDNFHPRVHEEFECDAAEVLSKNMHSITTSVFM